MKLLNQMVRNFFWKPAGCVPSLTSLKLPGDIASRQDVTMAVGGQKGSHPVIVIELMNGKIIGDLRMVATAGDVAVGGMQSLFGCPDPQHHYLLKRRRFRLQKFYRGTALLLGTANSDNYYHWLLDCVPRWKMLQAANWSNYDFVLLSSRSSPFQDEVLDRLKVPMAKRLRCSKNFIHQFERLVVPDMPYPVEEVSVWACDYVRSLFPEKVSGPEKIYLHRGGTRRRLANEAELEKALHALGFISYEPDKFTVAEQARFLSSARCVVAPHGGALANLVFVPAGAMVLELFHPRHKNRCYVNLAAACGHRYLGMDGCPVERSTARALEYTVDVAAVTRAIEKEY